MSAASCSDALICDGPGCAFSSREWARLQALSISKLVKPSDRTNAYETSPAAIALGQAFFSDARFSGPSTQLDALKRPAAVGRAPAGQPAAVSCASCHDLGRGGADTESTPGNVSAGAGWSDVNALPVVNAVYQRLFTWNGRADSLWAQAFAVAENPTTMNGNRLHTLHVILDNYWDAYTSAFGAPLLDRPTLAGLPSDGKPVTGGCNASNPAATPFDCLPANQRDEVTRVQVNWAKALAAYESTLVTGATPFDRFLGEGPGSDAISAAGKRGARLFVSKAGCIDCHATPLFSDGDFHDVGVPQAGPAVPTLADCPAGNKVCDCTGTGSGCLPWGLYDGVQKLSASSLLRTSRWSDDPLDTSRAADVGRPLTDALKGAWRTPSLRNVARTAPYMHDGVYATLEEVVAHYSRGSDPGAVGTPAADIKPLFLGNDEQADLVAFLETLSSSTGGPDSGLPPIPDARSLDGRDPLGPIPGMPLATFDASTEGFSLDNYDTPSNLAVHNAGVAPATAWDASEGSPTAGSIRLSVPFTDYSQLVVLRRNAAGLDWTGKKLHVRVKVASGFNPDPAFPSTGLLFVQTTSNYVFFGQNSYLDRTTGWQTITFVVDSATVAGFDARQVTGFGVLFTTGTGADGDGGAATGKPSPAVIFVDSFSLE